MRNEVNPFNLKRRRSISGWLGEQEFATIVFFLKCCFLLNNGGHFYILEFNLYDKFDFKWQTKSICHSNNKTTYVNNMFLIHSIRYWIVGNLSITLFCLLRGCIVNQLFHQNVMRIKEAIIDRTNTYFMVWQLYVWGYKYVWHS